MLRARAARLVGIVVSVGLVILTGLMFARPGALVSSANAHPEPIAQTEPFPVPPDLVGVELLRQTAVEANRKSNGCVACHKNTCDPHAKATLQLGCVDCHGGNPCALTMDKAHEHPRNSADWP